MAHSDASAAASDQAGPATDLLRTRQVFAHARRVFDDDTDARRWLSAPNDALSGERPLALLHTDAGVRLVDDVLTRLEFGVYA